MGLNIKKAIKEHGLEVREVAKRMEISPTGLSQHINGNPSVEVLERIARAIGCDVSELFERESKTELTALIEHKNDFYKAETLDGLKEIVKKIEEKE